MCLYFTVLILQMDAAAISFACDDDLQELGISAKGDLYALRAFCKKEPSKPNDAQRENLKKKLLDQLFSKRRRKRGHGESQLNQPRMSGTGAGNGDEKLKTRKFQLGWLHFREEKKRYGMVRTSDGGGTRDVDLPFDSTKDDVITFGNNFFFENGMSKFGLADAMDFDLGNFKCERITSLSFQDGSTQPFTLSGYFEASRLKRARLYIMSRLKEDATVTPRPLSSQSSSSDESLLTPAFSSGKKTENVVYLSLRLCILFTFRHSVFILFYCFGLKAMFFDPKQCTANEMSQH